MLGYPASIKTNQKCTARYPNNQKAKFFLSFAYLALQRFELASRYYTPRQMPELLERKCLSPLELCQYILAKGVRKHGSKALF